MRKLCMIIGLVFGLGLLAHSGALAESMGHTRLSLIQGDVVIQTPDAGTEWGAASINTPLVPGMKLWVPEGGKAEVQFVGGTYLRVDGNTEVDVTNLKIDGQENISQVGLPQGRTYIYYPGSSAKNTVFQVDTPLASAKAYGRSEFMVNVYEDGYTEVSAVSGPVYVESQRGNTTVGAGNMLSVGSDQTAEISPMRQVDAWLAWNQSRDSVLAKAGASRNRLPPALAVYSGDLDSNGRWVYSVDLGYVWTPFQVGVDWAPYRVGRWCWIGGDYVWVSYEPWGWVPYHYGRWSFVANIGWCWVPPAMNAFYWGPGFVAWIGTSNFVSWVPLAPGEIYYGHGYYGPFSVNIANINIYRVKVTNVYSNAYVRNAVTVVGRETFLTGRPERLVNIPANPFREGFRPSIGRPDIRPVKATAVPIPARVVPGRSLPPRETTQRAARVEHRPVGVNRDVSVFKPGQRVAPMPTRRVEHPPNAAIQKVQRFELGRHPVERREALTPPVQKGGVHPPTPHRETGAAAQFGKEQKAVRPSHAPESKTLHREQLNKPQGITKPGVQKPPAVVPHLEQTGPAQREFGQSPAFNERTGKPPGQGKQSVSPPVQRQGTARPPQRQERR